MPTIPKNKKKEQGGDLARRERQKIYQSRQWRLLRVFKLINNPVCERCGREFSAEVHHRDSFMNYTRAEERYRKAFDVNNLEALCSHCHKSLHGAGKKTAG